MRRLAVWVDDYAARSLPKLEAELSRVPAMFLRSFVRLPNPATIAQLVDYQQIAVIGGVDFTHLVSRVEAATASLRIGVVAVLPPGSPNASLLRGAGVLDILTAQLPQAAARIALMANVPIVASRGRRIEVRPPAKPTLPHPPPSLAPFGLPPRKALGIASSTGGCWLAAELIRTFPRGSTGPIFLAQHMDDEFVGFFSEWIESTVGRKTVVARGRVPLEDDAVYLAEGACDLVVSPEGHEAYSAPACSRLVPSADRLFRSIAAAFGPRATAVVLSGMGDDGSEGLVEVVKRGGLGICQDPETAIIRSMPASALLRAKGALSVQPLDIPEVVSGRA